MTLEKTASGYVLSSEEKGLIEYFEDDDNSRKKLIKAVSDHLFELVNGEVEGGHTYR